MKEEEKTPNILSARKAEQAKASIISICGAFLIMILFATGGIMVGSTTMLLSSASSLIMVVTGMLMFFAVHKLNREADEIFNFGYGKYEPFTVVVQGLLIISACVMAIKFALQDLIHPEDIKNYQVPAVVCVFSGIIGWVIYLYLQDKAKRAGTGLIEMTCIHWRTDIILSAGLFCGFFAGLVITDTGRTGFIHYLDPIMAIILALYLMKAPLSSVMTGSRELLDATPSKDIRGKIQKVIDEHRPLHLNVSRVRSRKAGRKLFLDVCFEVHSSLTATDLSKHTDRFRKDIGRLFPDSDVLVVFKAA